MNSIPIADDTHQLVFLVQTQLNEGRAEELSAALPAHLEFLQRQFAEGRLLFGGPLVTSDLQNTGNGVYALRAETLEAAAAIAAADPLHHGGIRTAQIHHWMLKTDYTR